MLSDQTTTLGQDPDPASTMGLGVDDYFQERLSCVADYDKKTAVECAESLLASGEMERLSEDVLESLYFLGLRHERSAERAGLDVAEVARIWAGILEHRGEAHLAAEVLLRVANLDPEDRSLERELAGIMRRSGRVHELVDRYMERSNQLLKKGRTMEAIPWLQEVLLVDRSRRDVARMIRDLRYKDVEDEARSKRRRRGALASVLVLAIFAVVGMREIHVLGEFQALPQADKDDLASARTRLASLQAFTGETLAWHRSFSVKREVEELQSEVLRLEDAKRREAEKIVETEEKQVEKAEAVLAEGLAQAEVGELEQALASFKKARDLGGNGWMQLAQVERDIKAIEEWLIEGSK